MTEYICFYLVYGQGTGYRAKHIQATDVADAERKLWEFIDGGLRKAQYEYIICPREPASTYRLYDSELKKRL